MFLQSQMRAICLQFISIISPYSFKPPSYPRAAMGRRSTGVYTTRESVRLELAYLIREGYIRKNSHIKGWLTWTNGSSINFESKYTEEEKYLRLMYTLSDQSGIKHEFDYTITLATELSNLGKGQILYFICPRSGSRCRILYKAYGSHIWKSRLAYSNRIYYPIQLSSKLSKYNDRFWEISSILKLLHKSKVKSSYKGKLTKKAKRINKLEREKSKMDALRWSTLAMPKSLKSILKIA